MKLTKIPSSRKLPETADSRAVRQAFQGIDRTCKKIISIRPKNGKDSQIINEAMRKLDKRTEQMAVLCRILD